MVMDARFERLGDIPGLHGRELNPVGHPIHKVGCCTLERFKARRMTPQQNRQSSLAHDGTVEVEPHRIRARLDQDDTRTDRGIEHLWGGTQDCTRRALGLLQEQCDQLWRGSVVHPRQEDHEARPIETEDQAETVAPARSWSRGIRMVWGRYHVLLLGYASKSWRSRSSRAISPAGS